MKERWCEGCLMAGKHVPATTRSINPDYAKYVFCEECASKYSAMLINEDSDVDNQNPYPFRESGAKKREYGLPRRLSHHQAGKVIMKYGGKHHTGCFCDVCGGMDGKHTHLCACPHCGEKEGEHKPYCFCPICFESGGKHHPYCECPVCYHLG